jgi:hypothetical protein
VIAGPRTKTKIVKVGKDKSGSPTKREPARPAGLIGILLAIFKMPFPCSSQLSARMPRSDSPKWQVSSGNKILPENFLDHWLEANATWHRHPADGLSSFLCKKGNLSD